MRLIFPQEMFPHSTAPVEKNFYRKKLYFCYFLVPNKKVTKEVGIGEALSVALPRAKSALS